MVSTYQSPFYIIGYMLQSLIHFVELVVGALAITIANPTDLVKVRLQSEGQLPSGVPKRYSGAMDAYSTILRQVRLSSDVFFWFLYMYIMSHSVYIC